METDSWLVSAVIKLLRRIGLQTLGSLFLLMISLGTAALAAANAQRELDAAFFLSIVSAGAAAGWLLARSRLAASWASAAAAGLGLGWASLFIGRLWNPLFVALLELKNLLIELYRWIRIEDYGLPALLPFNESVLDFSRAAQILGQRFGLWVGGIVYGQPVPDPLAAALAWGLCMWLIAVWASWAVRRLGQPLAALLPAGVVLSGVINYTGASTYSLLAFLGGTFLLILHVLQQKRETTWEMQKIDYPQDMRFDLALPTLPLVVFILILAAVIPSISFSKLVDLSRSFSGEGSARSELAGEALGLERYQPPGRTGNWVQGGLPRSHLLQAELELSEQPALVVKTGDLPPGPEAVLAGSRPPAYYWRALTFEYYTGKGWSNAEPTAYSYQAGQLARFNDAVQASTSWTAPPGYRFSEHEITVLNQASGILYSAGYLIAADQPYQAAWRVTSEFSSGEPGGGDLVGGTIEVQVYRVKALAANPSLDQLQQAGAGYPEWIGSRYLALPATLPQRVYTLALDLTANAAAPYERARAIEKYLRDIPYNLTVSLPPAERDVVDYYLFDLRSGYCDYAASAMVVLARAAGLPARLVMGYSGGSYDTYQARYEISEANAHSWAEVYFAGVGWVEFEPTGSLPELHREPYYSPPPNDRTAEALTFAKLPARAHFPVYWTAAGLSTVLLFAAAASIYEDQRRLRQIPPQAAVQLIYQRFLHLSGKLQRKQPALFHSGSTPYEYAESVSSSLKTAMKHRVLRKGVAPAFLHIPVLTHFYIQTVYSPHPPEEKVRSEMARIWMDLRWRLWLAVLLHPKK